MRFLIVWLLYFSQLLIALNVLFWPISHKMLINGLHWSLLWYFKTVLNGFFNTINCFFNTTKGFEWLSKSLNTFLFNWSRVSQPLKFVPGAPTNKLELKLSNFKEQSKFNRKFEFYWEHLCSPYCGWKLQKTTELKRWV